MKPAAIILPMPREPPVTSAVRPASEKRSVVMSIPLFGGADLIGGRRRSPDGGGRRDVVPERAEARAGGAGHPPDRQQLIDLRRDGDVGGQTDRAEQAELEVADQQRQARLSPVAVG